jgi:acetyl esterase/lipase
MTWWVHQRRFKRRRTTKGGTIVTNESVKTESRRYYYGTDSSQYGELYRPPGPCRRGTIVLFHGGWWGRSFGSDILHGVAEDLCGRGWLVWNVEYRRLGIGGGFPTTLLDVASAVDHLATLDEVDTDFVVALGHSAGGHLATWAAGRKKLRSDAPGANPTVEVVAVVSLAGVLDFTSAARERIGNDAVLEFMGGNPERRPDRYEVADPLSQVPISAIVICCHGDADDIVPVTQSVSYVAAAQSAGQDARLLQVNGNHFTIVDPPSNSWPAIIAALEDITQL